MKTKDMMEQLIDYFKIVEIPMTEIGERQGIESLIIEVLLFAKYLRNEIMAWTPCIASI